MEKQFENEADYYKWLASSRKVEIEEEQEGYYRVSWTENITEYRSCKIYAKNADEALENYGEADSRVDDVYYNDTDNFEVVKLD